MKIQGNTKKKIDEVAEKRLSHLHPDTFPFEIVGCLYDFKNDLSNRDILTDEFEKSELTHSEKRVIDLEVYLQYLRDIARFTSRYFGTEHAYVSNKKTHDGIIFIGHPNHVYATCIAFEYLTKIADSIRENYLGTLKRYKKQSTKDELVEDHLSEWLESLTEIARYEWYSASKHRAFSDYIKKHFKTSEDKSEVMLHAIEIIKPIYDETIDKNIT